MINRIIDIQLRNIADLEARIRQTVRDLEEHSRGLPSSQQGKVEATIEKLKKALEWETSILDRKPEHL